MKRYLFLLLFSPGRLIFTVTSTLTCAVILAGCIDTEGTVEMKGKVVDEYTNEELSKRKIIIKGVIESNNKLLQVEAGEFSTDTEGYFTFSLKKVKDAYFYNFFIVGDSDYAFTTKKLGLMEIERNSQNLVFSLSRLAGLTIKIQKTSNLPFYDTLYLFWGSNRAGFRTLYPYKIENFGSTDLSFVILPGLGLRWIGGNVTSTVSTRVFADKLTEIHWELVRNKKREEFKDTITCKRDSEHTVYFTY